MNRMFIALAMGLALGASASAQDVRPDPAQATAPVASTGYVSALADYHPATPPDGTPASNWAASNAAVGKSGHAGHGMHAAPVPPAQKADEVKKVKEEPAQEHHHEH